LKDTRVHHNDLMALRAIVKRLAAVGGPHQLWNCPSVIAREITTRQKKAGSLVEGAVDLGFGDFSF
jgi:hypothetical protein